jgi:hypothetical protein
MAETATWPRNVGPMLAAKRAKDEAAKTAKAVGALVELGWTRSVTAEGLTLTEPRREDSVKPSRNG